MKDSITYALGVAVAAACLGLAAGSASAATMSCTAQNNGGQNIEYSLANATDKLCVSSANDTNTIDSSFVMFGEDNWILADKNGDESGGNQNIVFTGLSTANGTWAISANAFEIASQIVVTLKQSSSFAAFLIAAGETSGTWSTSGPGGSSMGLSHGSVYYLPGDTTTVIPLPAALPLFLGALGGLGFLGWRRRATTAV